MIQTMNKPASQNHESAEWANKAAGRNQRLELGSRRKRRETDSSQTRIFSDQTDRRGLQEIEY